MKKNTKATCRKSITFFAAAAVTAALLGGQAYPTAVLGQSQTVEKGSLIPENVTIDQPTCLSDIALPKSDYGTLYWVDDSYVPDRRVQSCKVEFRPNGSVDLSEYSGWDAEKGVLTGYITVVVSSIESSNENYEEDSGSGDSEDEMQADSEDSSGSDSGEGSEASASSGNDQTETGESVTEAPESENTEEPEKAETPGIKETEEPQEAENPGAEETKEPEEAETPGTKETEEPQEAENPGAEETKEPEDAAKSGEGAAKENEGTKEQETEIPNAVSPTPGAEESLPENTDQEHNNIFDQPVDFNAEDVRSSEAEENLSPEEQAERARENHSCDGIFVSGIELPWYVQFRVSSGESYEFKNEEDALIFQSYEFELWDLKNNTEYQIPDGEYISVTVPVKEDYSYTIEHILDNGATETIIPSVEGGTMVFSTHSFSPFGIAGSKPLVGGDIAEDGYSGKTTPTPVPTAQATVTMKPIQTPAGSSGTNANAAGNAGSSTNSNNTSGTVSGGATKEGTVRNIYGDKSAQANDSSSQNSATGNTQNTNGSSAVNTVKTGDDTVILPFVILVAAAAVVIVVVVRIKKKNNHK